MGSILNKKMYQIPCLGKLFLDALDFKLYVSEWVIDIFLQLVHLRVFQIFFNRSQLCSNTETMARCTSTEWK